MRIWVIITIIFNVNLVWAGDIPCFPVEKGTIFLDGLLNDWSNVDGVGVDQRSLLIKGKKNSPFIPDIADDDPTTKTQVFPVDVALEVQEIRVVHAPVVAPDSVDVGLVCVSWLASPPTTTAAPTTTAESPVRERRENLRTAFTCSGAEEVTHL